jgi:hypothetical protein
VSHGCAHEETALNKFTEETGIKVQNCGLFVDVAHPYLGASPDGVVVGENAIVEVKCPFNGRQQAIAPGKNFLFLEKKEDGQIGLKTNHSYYHQVIGQMGISGTEFCYFITFTFCNIHIQKIPFDKDFYESKMLPSLSKFYFQNYLPHVVSSL